MFITLFLLILAYFIGSIPSGYLFAKYFFGIDIQKHGSGNIGATNVARVLGSKKYFLLIFLIDFFKAYLWMFFSKNILVNFNCEIYYSLIFIAISLLLGNAFSIFLKFSGGKGVSTLFGIICFISPLIIKLSFFIMWLIILLLFKRSDLASLGSTSLILLISCVIKLFVSELYPPLTFYIFVFLFLAFLHRKNLKKLLKSKIE